MLILLLISIICIIYTNAQCPEGDQEYLDRTILHEIGHAYTSKSLKRFEVGDKTLPTNVFEAAKRIDALRRSLKYKFKQNKEFAKSWKRVASFIDPDQINTEQLLPIDAVVYGLISNEEFVTMATEDPLFRAKVTDLSGGFRNTGGIFDELWNALLDLLGLNNLSQINKDYVINEVFQFINTIDKSLNVTIEKTKIIEGFQDNEKYKKLKEVLDSLEKDEQKKIIIEVPIKSIESPLFKDQIDLELNSKEQELLIEKHGKEAVENYNELTNEEKEYIIKCLR